MTNPLEHVHLLASYNRWMNGRIHDAAATLPAAELNADRKAFFGSIIGTLNHLIVADTIWLKRFATHPTRHVSLEPLRGTPQPASLNQILHADLGADCVRIEIDSTPPSAHGSPN